MTRSTQIKVALIVIATVWALYSLWPTIQLARGTDGMSDEKVTSLEDKAIRRGLDLAGGMYLVLEVDESQLGELSRGEALDRVMTIIRQRIDEFGVSEPVIQKEGDSRIVVQLPGVQDAVRAKALIGRTARLEFRMVREGNEVTSLLRKVDRVLTGGDASANADTSTVELTEDGPVTEDSADDIVPGEAGADTVGELDAVDLAGDLDPENPFSALLGPYLAGYGAIGVPERNKARVDELLQRREVQRVMPRDAEFLWAAETQRTQDGGIARLLYLVEKDVAVSGGEIQNAVVTPDPDRPPQLMVSLTLTRKGGLRFSTVTGANVGRKLGIVLDAKVNSAPNIQQKISGGRASISGGFANDEEARDLALMLRAGALPVDVRIEEERTVGPSLGADSIRQGVNSVLIGGVVVILFMLIYYRAAGVLATFGLILTVLLLMGILAQLHLTLTLPGIAGIILTVGMAVDANVLIFERIRDELRNGKSVRASIDAGYEQATRAIIDANITTFIAAVVLFYFGTGPIKGFAVTLSIGILTSMFAALVFTRTMYELWLQGRQPRSLSI